MASWCENCVEDDDTRVWKNQDLWHGTVEEGTMKINGRQNSVEKGEQQ